MPTDREYWNKNVAGMVGSEPLAGTAANLADQLDQRTISFWLPPDAFANTNSSSSIIFCTDRKIKVLEVAITPFGANIAGHGSNYVTWVLDWNDGAGGAASNILTANTNTSGLNNALVFGTKTTIAAANITSANTVINANSCLRLSSIKTGTGVACPATLFSIRIQEV